MTARELAPATLLLILCASCAGSKGGNDTGFATGASASDSAATETGGATDSGTSTTATSQSGSSSAGSTGGPTSASDTAATDSAGTDTGGGEGAGLTPVDLVVDFGGNRVLEPGEGVSVVPTWQNPHAQDRAPAGTLSDIAGPAGGSYLIAGAQALYNLMAGAAGACETCYQVSIGDPATRPASHWDITFTETLDGGTPVTWQAHVGESFSDVPTSNAHYASIEALFHNNVTSGCGSEQFCPANNQRRDQTAIFLAAAMAGGKAAVPSTGSVPGLGAYDCKLAGTSVFNDVAPDSVGCASIHYIAAASVTLGCGANPPTFCPLNDTTRQQMAIFSSRAALGAEPPETYNDPDTGRSYSCADANPNLQFSDVAASSTGCEGVHYAWARGFMAGCTVNTFCPADPILRDEAASAVAGAFGLGVTDAL